MNISLQNTDENIRLLAAQKHIYTEAKKLHRWRITGAIVLAGISPIIVFFLPDFKPLLLMISAIYLIVVWIFKGTEITKVKQAAIIQEQFDTELFKLPWNQTLVGDKLAPELIYAADREFRDDRRKLKDWYVDPGDIPFHLCVLICQRTNIVWDWKLHQKYWKVIAIATIFWFIITIIILIISKISPYDYVVGLLLPSAPALIQGIDISKEHYEVAKEKEYRANEISKILEKNPNSVTIEQCREIQNYIYFNRKGPFVPDWFYDRLRDQIEKDTASAVAQFKKILDKD